MALAGKQRLKLLYLIRLLHERTDDEHPISMEEILAVLEKNGIRAERKSIYDDLDALRLFGYDIQMQRGRGGGYSLGQRSFDLPELKMLVDLVQASKFLTEKKSLQLIKKLEGLTSAPQAAQMQRQVYIFNRVKSMNESIYYNVDRIHAAITADRQITFKYFKWSPDKQRVPQRGGALYRVSPWALHWDDENYYLIAFDAAAGIIKHYRVDNMTSISQTDDKREGAGIFDKFDMAQYAKRVFGMFGGEPVAVTLACADSLAGVIIDRFGRDIPIHRGADGRFTVTVSVVPSGQFLSWIFGLSPAVKILAPQATADAFRQHALLAAKQYE